MFLQLKRKYAAVIPECSGTLSTYPVSMVVPLILGSRKQFDAVWHFFLSRSLTRAWLCDSAQLSLAHALSQAAGRPLRLTTRDNNNTPPMDLMFFDFRRDGPFSLGAIIECGDQEFKPYLSHVVLGRSAIYQIPDQDIALIATFSWLSSGNLFVRFGVVAQAASNHAIVRRICTWECTRMFDQRVVRGVSQPDPVDGELPCSHPSSTAGRQDAACVRCSAISGNACSCHPMKTLLNPLRNSGPSQMSASLMMPLYQSNSFSPFESEHTFMKTSSAFDSSSCSADLCSDGEGKQKVPNTILSDLRLQINAAMKFKQQPVQSSEAHDRPISADDIGAAGFFAHSLLSSFENQGRTQSDPLTFFKIDVSKAQLGTRNRTKTHIKSEHSPGFGSFSDTPPLAGSIAKRTSSTQFMECSICGLKIRGKRGNLNRHIATRHLKARAFACAMPRCNQALTSKLNLVRHMTRVHEGRPHRCVKCPRGFRSAGSLEKHVRAAHGARDPFICHACAICFGRRSVLENHVSRMHNGTMPPPDARTSFLCPLPDCGRRYWEWKDLQKHEQDAHAGRVHCCTGCESVFETESNLSKHIRTGHEHSSSIMNCPVCGCTKSERSNLMRHIRLAHKDFLEQEK